MVGREWDGGGTEMGRRDGTVTGRGRGLERDGDETGAARKPYPTDFVATRETPVPHTFSQMTSPNAMGTRRERLTAARATSPASALGTGALVR